LIDCFNSRYLFSAYLHVLLGLCQLRITRFACHFITNLIIHRDSLQSDEYLVKWKTWKYHTVGTVPKFNRKMIENGQIYALNIQIHDRSRSWLGTVTSVKRSGAKLVLWTYIFPLREMIRSCKCFPLVSKMLTSYITNSVIMTNATILNTGDNIFYT